MTPRAAGRWLLAIASLTLALPCAQAGPISAFAGSTATRMALTAPDVSPLAPEELDLRRPALLSGETSPRARLGWTSEDVIRWWRPGVEAGDISSESAGLALSVPLRTGAIGLELERGWSHASYATDRDAAARLPRERIAVAYGWPAGRGLRLGVALERSESDARAEGTYLGGLLNSAPSGALDLPFKSRTLSLEGRRDWGKREVALRVNRCDASFPVTLVNGADTATIDLGHEGLGWGVEAFQRLNERVRLCAFGGSSDRSGRGQMRYKQASYGQAEAGFYDMWFGFGGEWRSDSRTAVWGEALLREASASARGTTTVPGSLASGAGGNEFRFHGRADLSVKALRVAAQRQGRGNVTFRIGAQVSRVDADAGWSSQWRMGDLIPIEIGNSTESLNGARLYILGAGVQKHFANTGIEFALAQAFAETPRKPRPPAPPPAPGPRHQTRGGLAVALSVTRRF